MITAHDHLPPWPRRLRKAMVGLALTGLLAGPALSAEPPADLTFKAEEVVSRSFPPNLNWLNYGQPGFDARAFATFAPGQWVEYVLPIPAAGTYRVKARAAGGRFVWRCPVARGRRSARRPRRSVRGRARDLRSTSIGEPSRFLKARESDPPPARRREESKEPGLPSRSRLDPAHAGRRLHAGCSRGRVLRERRSRPAMVGRGAEHSLHRLSRRCRAADNGRHLLRDAQPERRRTPLERRCAGCGGPHAALEPLPFHGRRGAGLPGSGFHRQSRVSRPLALREQGHGAGRPSRQGEKVVGGIGRFAGLREGRAAGSQRRRGVDIRHSRRPGEFRLGRLYAGGRRPRLRDDRQRRRGR